MKVNRKETKTYTYTLEGLSEHDVLAIKAGLQMLGAGFPRTADRIRTNTAHVVRNAGAELYKTLDNEFEDEEG